MEIIEIKRLNDELYLKLNDLIDFQKLYDLLEEKIMLIKEQNLDNKLKFKVILLYIIIISK